MRKFERKEKYKTGGRKKKKCLEGGREGKRLEMREGGRGIGEIEDG